MRPVKTRRLSAQFSCFIYPDITIYAVFTWSICKCRSVLYIYFNPMFICNFFFCLTSTRFSWYYSCILCGCLFSLLFNLPQLFFCTALEKHGRFPAIPVDGLWLELQLSSTKCGSNPIHNWTDFGREQPCFSSPGQPLSDTLYMNVAVGKYFLQPAIHVQSSDGAISEAESAPSTMGVGCNIQLMPCCKGQDKKKLVFWLFNHIATDYSI